MRQLFYDGGFTIERVVRSIGAATGFKRDLLAAGSGLDELPRPRYALALRRRRRLPLPGAQEPLRNAGVRGAQTGIGHVLTQLTRSLWLRALLTLAVLAVLALKIDMRAAGEALLRLRLDAAVAVLALLAADRAMMVWRWIILLRARGTSVSTKIRDLDLSSSARSSADSCPPASAPTRRAPTPSCSGPRAAATRSPRWPSTGFSGCSRSW